jgi:hypothetical protein
LLDHRADLDVPRLAADPGQDLRLRQPGAREEHPRQFLIAVLAGVD